MNLGGNTVLITGGASGIGFALAERFIRAGSQVAICGRRAYKLEEVKRQYPDIKTFVCDVGTDSDRQNLFYWVQDEIPQVNMLVNNAGIQRRFQLTEYQEPWGEYQQEIAINLEAPIHLSALFIPHLLKQNNPAIINVTSGLAFVPLAMAPVYSATKAALHSFTLSLRSQLAKTSIKVLEIVPPAVQTDLGGAGLHTFGAPLDEFADAIMAGLAAGQEEVGFGTSNFNRKASRQELEQVFNRMNPA